jgi:hypothetical protein
MEEAVDIHSRSRGGIAPKKKRFWAKGWGTGLLDFTCFA